MTARTSPSAQPAPLVGRERELAVMDDRLAAALAGQGNLVLIGGEAGIGKTALAEALRREAVERGARVLVGRCYDLAETPPYGPWVELFARYRPPDEGPADAVPSLPPAFARRGTVGTVTSAAALAQQVCDFFATLAAARPIALVLDDLHWADPASLDLLRAVSHTLADLPLLVVATYRAEEVGRRHPLYALIPHLVREAQAVRLDLRPLTAEDVRALVAAGHHLAEVDATRLVAYLMQRAEGNPFYIGELLRTLVEEGTLRGTPDDWTLDDLTWVPVPPLLRQVIDGRLARLGEEAVRLLAVSAVIGQEVPIRVLAAVVGRDETVLLETVEQATAAHLVNAAEDGKGFQFTHTLIQEALYEGILPLRRRALHRQVGEALAATPHPNPDAVAHHFQRAGDERASVWLIAAGERAMSVHAFVTAAARFEAALPAVAGRDRAIALLALAFLHRVDVRSVHYAEEAVQVAEEAGDAVLAAICRLRLGAFLGYAGRLERAIAEMTAADSVLDALSGDVIERAGPTVLTRNLATATARGALRMLPMASSGRYRQATALLGCTLDEALTRPDQLHPTALLPLAYICAAWGRAQGMLDACEQDRVHHRAQEDWRFVALDVLRALRIGLLPYRTDDLAERARLVAELAEARARYEMGAGTPPPLWWVSWPLLVVEGRWEEARDCWAGGEAMPTFLRLRDAPIIATLAHARGERDAAWRLVKDLLPDGPMTAPGAMEFLPQSGMQRVAGALCLDAGDLATTRAWLESHDRWLVWADTLLGQAEGQVLWARYYRQRGNAERAQAHGERALAHATEPRQPLALLAAHRLLGELDADAGRFADAAPHFAASLALADACAAPYERALTLLALAALHAARQDREEAVRLLDEVRAICVPLDAEPALARADALREHLTHTPAPEPIYPAGLTAREVDVLRLIAAGKSNRAIATALFISERTVNRHMTNLYTKIDAHSKADATAYAIRNHLA